MALFHGDRNLDPMGMDGLDGETAIGGFPGTFGHRDERPASNGEPRDDCRGFHDEQSDPGPAH